MTAELYKRFDLAANQLETAIMVFLTGGDKFSVITLAGAADVIFCQLVLRQGKENFTDFMLKETNDTRTRQEAGKEINDTLRINALKHFDKDDDEYVSIDVDECALGAILKAIANYNMLDGKNDKLIQAFLYWVKTNLDPKKYNVGCDPNWNKRKLAN